MSNIETSKEAERELDVLKALASDVRLAILRWLKDPQRHFQSVREGDLAADGGVCVTLIARRAGVAQPTVSRHLDRLRRAGLVTTRRTANFTFHYRDEAGIARARRIVERV